MNDEVGDIGKVTTRTRIVDVADTLFYERGFQATSFADIAAEVGLSRGNFYYHFRTKDEILDAVILRRAEATHRMLCVWADGYSLPSDRLLAFAHILVTNQSKIMSHGCPVGTLCGELAKQDHAALGDAAGIFTLFRDWLAAQFASLGFRPDHADNHAMHLLMRSQGIASLAAAYRDETFIDRELAAIATWLENLRPPHETTGE